MTKQEKDARIKELEALIEKNETEMVLIKKTADQYNAMQLGLKITMNAAYGSFCNKHFVCYSLAVGSTITAHGRDLIQTMERTNEEYWYEMFHDDLEFHENIIKFKKVLEYIEINDLDRLKIINDDVLLQEVMDKIDFSNIKVPTIDKIDNRYIRTDSKEIEPKPIKSEIFITGEVRRIEPVSAYCDTDSVDASSILRTEKGVMTIENYYNDCFNNKKDIIEDVKGHEIVFCNDNRTILNYKDGILYQAKVKKVIRHKVKKEKWLIECNNKKIFVTNDHSMVVFRNEIQTVVKPYEILPTDKILITDGENYSIENISKFENVGFFENEYVYDIEMYDETHTFIANDILVHNSLFVSFKPALKKLNIKENQLDIVHFMSRTRMQDFFKEKLEEYATKFKVPSQQDFEMEQISKSIIYLQKKMYVKNVVWEEGVYNEPETNFQAKGIDLVRSSSPSFVRNKYNGVYKIINYYFQNPETMNDRELVKLVRGMKDLFKLEPIENISMTSGVNKYDEKVIDDTDSLKIVKGAHHAVKAAALHNYLLNQNSELKKKYNLIKSGQKIKYYYTTNTLSNEFAYGGGMYPKEIADKYAPIDYDTQFEKCVLGVVNRFNKALGLSELTSKLTFTMSLF